ncbi:hypothetical protein TIFTF001_022519 [Ficus carica]|uniref:Uncharacterized protein n=1 Tax=Ficus carica TaxID=3494 RepID=A0AA88ACQ9_FICCA|nr:hypothetical protein TIFTF001_022519 [Ficus carica]
MHSMKLNVGLRCLSWVACVPHVQPVFHPCCWPSFHYGPIVSMVAPTLMGVALPKVAVVHLFSFVWFMCLFVSRAEVSPLVSHVGFCVDMDFVDRVLVVVWLTVVWLADLAFALPVIGVFLHAWDRRSLQLSSSGLIT